MTTKTPRIFPIPLEAFELAKAYAESYEEGIKKETEIHEEFKKQMKANAEQTKANMRQVYSRLASSVGLDPASFDDPNYEVETRYIPHSFAAIIFHEVDNAPFLQMFGMNPEDEDKEDIDPMTEGAPNKDRLN